MESDRVMLHALRSLQQVVLRGGDARRISFRAVDEPSGHGNEGLVGYTAIKVEEPHRRSQGTQDTRDGFCWSGGSESYCETIKVGPCQTGDQRGGRPLGLPSAATDLSGVAHY